MVIRPIFAIAAIFAVVGCSGIAPPGLIYRNVIQPYSVDYHDTKIGTKHCVIDEHSVSEPFTGYGVSVEWSADVIQNAATKAGITEITCMDEQTLSFLLGIYKRERLIVYGN
jgi:hypothetical protein